MSGRGRQRRVCGPSIVDDLVERVCRVDGGCCAGSISNQTEGRAILDLDDHDDKQLQLSSWRCEENDGDHGAVSVLKAVKGVTTGGSACLPRSTSASTSAGVGRPGVGLREDGGKIK